MDNYTQPFQGIVYFAESEPETVKTMFKNLFVNSDKEMVQREAAIVTFLKKSHELRDKYFPGSYLYKDDMHSVTTYLFCMIQIIIIFLNQVMLEFLLTV